MFGIFSEDFFCRISDYFPGAVIAWLYEESSHKFGAAYAFLAGVVQTALNVFICFVKIPATL